MENDILEVKNIWDEWIKNLEDFEFIEPLERNQPMGQQIREGLDELFD